MEYRRKITYQVKTRGTADFMIISSADHIYLQGLVRRIFEGLENNTPLLEALIAPAHLGQITEPYGDKIKREKCWLDLLAGMSAKLHARVGDDWENITVPQANNLNKLLKHLGQKQIEFREQDEQEFVLDDGFTFGRK